MVTWLKPVSYTHLDVYKRQIKKRPFSPKAAILMTVSLAKGPKALMVIVNGLINVSPPSPERFFAQ